MLPDLISNDALRLEHVPDPSASWDDIQTFALTFNGFQEHGSFEKCAAIANEPRLETLTDVRTCLFFEQRRWRHYGDEPDPEAIAHIRSLVDRIRQIIAIRQL